MVLNLCFDLDASKASTLSKEEKEAEEAVHLLHTLTISKPKSLTSGSLQVKWLVGRTKKGVPMPIASITALILRLVRQAKAKIIYIRRVAKAKKDLKPYHDRLAQLYGPEFQRSTAFQSIIRSVAEDGRSPRNVVGDIGAPI